PCLSHYGYLGLQIATRGERLHASLARKDRGAVGAMLKALLGLTGHLEKSRPEVVFNVRDLNSAQAGFAMPEECGAWLDIHLPASASATDLVMEIEEVIRRERKAAGSARVTFHFETVHSGYVIPEKGPVVEALKAAFRERGHSWEPSPFPSHSDANILYHAGCKPIVLGPGRLEKAHRPDESISFTQVFQAAELYYLIGLNLLETFRNNNPGR
ncbi:MAG: M20/M25/M40 family metallo-hydrolase, partial [Thermodesulfobacteriota bacterium]